MKHHRTIQSTPHVTKWFCGAPLRVGGVIGALVLLLLLLTGGTAQAQSCTTTVTTAADSGAGTLRQAVLDVPSGGTICFDTAGVFATPQTITLSGSQIALSKSLTISGTGHANLSVSGGYATRVFELNAGHAVTMTGFTIRDGRVDKGAGFSVNGNNSTTRLTLANMTLHNNYSTATSGNGGGALYVGGAGSIVRLVASTIYSNSAAGAGGGIYVGGGQVTIDGSQVYSNVSAGSGGGIKLNGSALGTPAVVTVTQSSVLSNTAVTVGGGFDLATFARLTVIDSYVAGNRTPDNGGAICSNGVVTLLRSTVTRNSAQNGGALYFANAYGSYGALLYVSESAIFSNTATGTFGGGIRGFAGNIVVERSAIYSNTSNSGGGGVYIDAGSLAVRDSAVYANASPLGGAAGGGLYLGTTSTITNSSIYSNSTGGQGGGLYSRAPLTVLNSTVASNTAASGGGYYGANAAIANVAFVTLANNRATTAGGGLFAATGSTTNLSNTLVANSTTAGASGGDLAGTGAMTASQVLTGVLPLGALRDNGGATWTMALPAGSPALDAGAGCPPPETDQRGVVRPQGSACDIGAYEAPPMLPLTVTVAGTGGGTVASTPAGIDCGASCTTSFEAGVVVTLTATPDSFVRFMGWSGSCSGVGDCTVTMTATKAVTATFIACPAGVAYVNGAAGGSGTGVDWPNAYTDLQDALRMYNTCGAFDEIWVARGLYTPGITLSDTFTIPTGVAIYGGFAATETQRTERDWAANVTVLSGDLGGDDTTDANGVVTQTAGIVGDNAYQVALLLSITSTAPITNATRLDGFTITAGSATGPGYNRYGGGLFCHAYAAGSQCSPTLANVIFSGNQASVGGGMAAFAEGGESSPLLTGVRFEHNQAVIKSMGGGFAALGMFTAASPVLTDVTFYSNTAAFGGGMLIVTVSNSVSSAVLNNVIFDSNAGAVGGALTNIGYTTGASNPTLTDVVFRHNHTFIDSDYRTALNRVPNGNYVTVPTGGAIASAGYYGTAALTLTNASLLDNRSNIGGALVNFAGGGIANAMLRNTIVADNQAASGGGIANVTLAGVARLALTNGLLRDNYASTGGGALYHDASLARGEVAITNTTFYSNATGGEGGAIVMTGEGSYDNPNTLHLANSILWANQAVASSSQISTSAAATVTIAATLVEGGWNGAGVGVSGSTLVDGGGNVDGDPRFAEDENGNLGLLPGSPAIDAGANSFVDTLVDLAGGLRIFNGIVDMGAYEAHGFDFTIAGSSAQTTPVSSAFTTPLQITVTDAGGQPLGAGAAVTFVPPASGAGLSSAAPFTLTTNASGVVTAAVTANTIAGSYPVTVTARGVLTPAFFTLTNLGLPVTVTVAADVNPSRYGQAVIFTATVTATQGAATPAGTVRFSVDSQSVATYTLDASGIATYTAPSLTVGAHAVGASYGGDASFNAGASAPFTQTVNRAATGVALASAPNPSAYGQAVTFTATVTVTAPGAGLPTGVITFTDGATTLGTGALDVGGVATFTTSSLLAGLPGDTPALHSITAAYGGDGNFTGATSNAVDQVVNKAATTATLISGVNPAIFGQAITFTATVTVTAPGSAALAGEQVSFQDGAATLGSGLLDAGGVATFTTSSLASGVHTITAHYAGTPNITGTVALSLTQVVNKAGVAVQVTAAPNPAVHGQNVTITATLTISAPGAGAPTGVVTFTTGATPITGCTPVTLTGLQAVCTTSALPTGVFTLTAEYGGEGNFTGNTGTLTGGQAINRAATTAVITGAPNPSVFKQAVIFTATVSVDAPGAGVPTGVVTFTAGVTSLGVAALDASGVATVTNANLVVGDHAIAAQYGGAGDFLPTSADVYTHTVSKAGATTALAMAPNPARYGQAVTFTATVTAASVTDLALLPSGPTGSVRFTDTTGAIDLTGTLSSGVATAIGGVLPAGSYTVTATYLGDNSYAGSASAAGVLVVVQYATQVVLSSSANPVFVDNSLSFTAAVSDLAADQAGAAGVVTGPTGSVTIADSSGVISLTGALVNGSVTLDAPWLPAGTYTLTAAYHGDAKYAPGVSAAFAQGVNRHGTDTVLVVAPTFAFVGDAIELTATVAISDPAISLSGGITGTVDFLLNGVNVGSAELVDGQAYVSGTASVAGVFTVTASYRGNERYADSDASGVLLTVAKRGSATTLTSTPNPAPTDAEVVFTANVAELLPAALAAAVGNPPRTPSGEVLFTENDVELGRGMLIAGTATFTTSLLAAGEHAIVAHYLGDDAFLSSASPVYTQTIQPRPLAVNDAAGTRQGEPVTIAPLANDHDPAGGGLGVTAITPPAHGAAVIDGDGIHVTYTPAAEFVGLDAFTYTAQDTHGLTTTATVAVVVSAKVDSNAPQVAPVDTTQPTTITFSSGEDAVVVIVPPDAYDGSAGPLGPTDIFFVAFTEIVTPSVHIATPPGGLRFAGKSYTLEVFFNQTPLEHYQFPQPLTILIGYTPADGMNAESLQLFYWDTATQQWSQAGLQEIGRDLVNDTITYLVSHFTEFGLFGSAAPTALEPEEEPALSSFLYLPVIGR
jgi:hypothetical protein